MEIANISKIMMLLRYRYASFILIGYFIISIFAYLFIPKYIEFTTNEDRREIISIGVNEKGLDEFNKLADRRKFTAESIALPSLLIAGIGTLSTIALGWKTYVKNNREAELRIEKLELELEELKRKDTRKKQIAQDSRQKRVLKSPKTETKLLSQKTK